MNQDLLVALQRASEKAMSKRATAANHVSRCENSVALLQDRLRAIQNRLSFNVFRYEEIDRQHQALLDHYRNSDNRPPSIAEQLQDLASQRTLVDQKVKDDREAETDCKRELEEAESRLAFARKQEREAANKIVAINQEIQRADNLN